MLAQIGSVHTARWCAALVKRNHDITVISNSWKKQDIAGVETVFLPGFSPGAYFFNIPKVRKQIAHINPEIVHAHYATGFGLWGSVQNSAPLVVSVWGTDIVDARRSKLTGIITRRALKKARAITATSQFLLNETTAFYPPTKEKAELVPFGIAIPSNEDLIEKQSNEAVTFIFTKIFLENYAPEMVIKAFTKAKNKMPSAQLKMFGGGPLHDSMIKLVQSCGLKDSVFVEGYISHLEVSEEIKKADVMVMPSYGESFGVAAVEASACGLPVIATRVGGIPEVITHNENGILIEPGDCDALTEAMILLGNNAGLRYKMGQAGRKIAQQRFDEEICLDKMETVYQKMRST